MATQEEIEKLKASWLKDPCWDIEDTDGFGEHHEELLAFRKERDSKWQLEEEDRIARRARVVEIETDITKSGAAQAISTYQEIENSIERTIQQSENVDFIAIAQVRATLLLAAQTQRVANGIWELISSIESSDNQEFLSNLWKVEK